MLDQLFMADLAKDLAVPINPNMPTGQQASVTVSSPTMAPTDTAGGAYVGTRCWFSSLAATPSSSAIGRRSVRQHQRSGLQCTNQHAQSQPARHEQPSSYGLQQQSTHHDDQQHPKPHRRQFPGARQPQPDQRPKQQLLHAVKRPRSARQRHGSACARLCP